MSKTKNITFEKPWLKFLMRSIAWITVACFVCQDISLAQGGVVPSWSHAQSSHQSSDNTKSFANIQVPYDVGVRHSDYQSNGDQIIVNIQDAHASIDAQKSISKIVESLVGQYDVELIGLEGAKGAIDTSMVSSFPIDEVRQKTATQLLNQSKISGTEFYQIVSQGNVELFGVEDESLYDTNIQTYRHIISNLPAINHELVKINFLIKQLQDQVFSSELLSFMHQRNLHNEGSVEFQPYWKTLKSLLPSTHNLSQYPNLSLLANAAELESSINYEGANKQRDALVDLLKDKLSDAEVKELILMTREFFLGKLTPGYFHDQLVHKAVSMGIQPEPFEDLIKYAEHALLLEEVDMITFFTELNQVEELVEDSLAEDEEGRQLLIMGRVINVLAKFLETKMTKDDDKFFRANSERFNFDFMHDYFLNQEHISEHDYHAINWNYLKNQIPHSQKFYDTARARNDALLGNLYQKMKEKGVKIAALVSGGYHTEGLVELMEKDQVSHIVFMPKFSEKEGERPYLTIITQKNSILDQETRHISKYESIALLLFNAVENGMNFNEAKDLFVHSYMKSWVDKGYEFKFDPDNASSMEAARKSIKGALKITVEPRTNEDPLIYSDFVAESEAKRLLALSKLERLEQNQLSALREIQTLKKSMTHSFDTVSHLILDAKKAFVQDIRAKDNQKTLQKNWKLDWTIRYERFLRKKGILSLDELPGEVQKTLKSFIESVESEIEFEVNQKIDGMDSAVGLTTLFAGRLSPDSGLVAGRMATLDRGNGIVGYEFLLPVSELFVATTSIAESVPVAPSRLAVDKTGEAVEKELEQFAEATVEDQKEVAVSGSRLTAELKKAYTPDDFKAEFRHKLFGYLNLFTGSQLLNYLANSKRFRWTLKDSIIALHHEQVRSGFVKGDILDQMHEADIEIEDGRLAVRYVNLKSKGQHIGKSTTWKEFFQVLRARPFYYIFTLRFFVYLDRFIQRKGFRSEESWAPNNFLHLGNLSMIETVLDNEDGTLTVMNPTPWDPISIVVPNREVLPQAASKELIAKIIELADETDMTIFFNSKYAGASIPIHRHIQGMTIKFPITNFAGTPHQTEGPVNISILEEYPSAQDPRQVWVADSHDPGALVEEVWKRVNYLQENGLFDVVTEPGGEPENIDTTPFDIIARKRPDGKIAVYIAPVKNQWPVVDSQGQFMAFGSPQSGGLLMTGDYEKAEEFVHEPAQAQQAIAKLLGEIDFIQLEETHFSGPGGARAAVQDNLLEGSVEPRGPDQESDQVISGSRLVSAANAKIKELIHQPKEDLEVLKKAYLDAAPDIDNDDDLTQFIRLIRRSLVQSNFFLTLTYRDQMRKFFKDRSDIDEKELQVINNAHDKFEQEVIKIVLDTEVVQGFTSDILDLIEQHVQHPVVREDLKEMLIRLIDEREYGAVWQIINDVVHSIHLRREYQAKSKALIRNLGLIYRKLLEGTMEYESADYRSLMVMELNRRRRENSSLNTNFRFDESSLIPSPDEAAVTAERDLELFNDGEGIRSRADVVSPEEEDESIRTSQEELEIINVEPIGGLSRRGAIYYNHTVWVPGVGVMYLGDIKSAVVADAIDGQFKKANLIQLESYITHLKVQEVVKNRRIDADVYDGDIRTARSSLTPVIDTETGELHEPYSPDGLGVASHGDIIFQILWSGLGDMLAKAEREGRDPAKVYITNSNMNVPISKPSAWILGHFHRWRQKKIEEAKEQARVDAENSERGYDYHLRKRLRDIPFSAFQLAEQEGEQGGLLGLVKMAGKGLVLMLVESFLIPEGKLKEIVREKLKWYGFNTNTQYSHALSLIDFLFNQVDENGVLVDGEGKPDPSRQRITFHDLTSEKMSSRDHFEKILARLNERFVPVGNQNDLQAVNLKTHIPVFIEQKSVEVQSSNGRTQKKKVDQVSVMLNFLAGIGAKYYISPRGVNEKGILRRYFAEYKKKFQSDKSIRVGKLNDQINRNEHDVSVKQEEIKRLRGELDRITESNARLQSTGLLDGENPIQKASQFRSDEILRSIETLRTESESLNKQNAEMRSEIKSIKGQMGRPDEDNNLSMVAQIYRRLGRLRLKSEPAKEVGYGKRKFIDDVVSDAYLDEQSSNDALLDPTIVEIVLPNKKDESVHRIEIQNGVHIADIVRDLYYLLPQGTDYRGVNVEFFDDEIENSFVYRARLEIELIEGVELEFNPEVASGYVDASGTDVHGHTIGAIRRLSKDQRDQLVDLLSGSLTSIDPKINEYLLHIDPSIRGVDIARAMQDGSFFDLIDARISPPQDNRKEYLITLDLRDDSFAVADGSRFALNIDSTEPLTEQRLMELTVIQEVGSRLSTSERSVLDVASDELINLQARDLNEGRGPVELTEAQLREGTIVNQLALLLAEEMGLSSEATNILRTSLALRRLDRVAGGHTSASTLTEFLEQHHLNMPDKLYPLIRQGEAFGYLYQAESDTNSFIGSEGQTVLSIIRIAHHFEHFYQSSLDDGVYASVTEIIDWVTQNAIKDENLGDVGYEVRNALIGLITKKDSRFELIRQLQFIRQLSFENHDIPAAELIETIIPSISGQHNLDDLLISIIEYRNQLVSGDEFDANLDVEIEGLQEIADLWNLSHRNPPTDVMVEARQRGLFAGVHGITDENLHEYGSTEVEQIETLVGIIGELDSNSAVAELNFHPVVLKAIEEYKRSHDAAVIAVSTSNPQEAEQAIEAGASIIVSPKLMGRDFYPIALKNPEVVLISTVSNAEEAEAETNAAFGIKLKPAAKPESVLFSNLKIVEDHSELTPIILMAGGVNASNINAMIKSGAVVGRGIDSTDVEGVRKEILGFRQEMPSTEGQNVMAMTDQELMDFQVWHGKTRDKLDERFLVDMMVRSLMRKLGISSEGQQLGRVVTLLSDLGRRHEDGYPEAAKSIEKLMKASGLKIKAGELRDQVREENKKRQGQHQDPMTPLEFIKSRIDEFVNANKESGFSNVPEVVRNMLNHESVVDGPSAIARVMDLHDVAVEDRDELLEQAADHESITSRLLKQAQFQGEIAGITPAFDSLILAHHDFNLIEDLLNENEIDGEEAEEIKQILAVIRIALMYYVGTYEFHQQFFDTEEFMRSRIEIENMGEYGDRVLEAFRNLVHEKDSAVMALMETAVNAGLMDDGIGLIRQVTHLLTPGEEMTNPIEDVDAPGLTNIAPLANAIVPASSTLSVSEPAAPPPLLANAIVPASTEAPLANAIVPASASLEMVATEPSVESSDGAMQMAPFTSDDASYAAWQEAYDMREIMDTDNINRIANDAYINRSYNFMTASDDDIFAFLTSYGLEEDYVSEQMILNDQELSGFVAVTGVDRNSKQYRAMRAAMHLRMLGQRTHQANRPAFHQIIDALFEATGYKDKLADTDSLIESRNELIKFIEGSVVGGWQKALEIILENSELDESLLQDHLDQNLPTEPSQREAAVNVARRSLVSEILMSLKDPEQLAIDLSRANQTYFIHYDVLSLVKAQNLQYRLPDGYTSDNGFSNDEMLRLIELRRIHSNRYNASRVDDKGLRGVMRDVMGVTINDAAEDKLLEQAFDLVENVALSPMAKEVLRIGIALRDADFDEVQELSVLVIPSDVKKVITVSRTTLSYSARPILINEEEFDVVVTILRAVMSGVNLSVLQRFVAEGNAGSRLDVEQKRFLLKEMGSRFSIKPDAASEVSLYGKIEAAIEAERRGPNSSIDKLVIAVRNEASRKAYEQMIERWRRDGLVRSDLPIEIISNPVVEGQQMNIGSGGMMAHIIHYLATARDESLDESPREILRKSLIPILFDGGVSQRFFVGAKGSMPIPSENNDVTLSMFNLQNVLPLIHQVQREKRTGLMGIAGDVVYISDHANANSTNAKGLRVELLTVQEGAEKVNKALGVIVTDESGRITRFIEKPDIDKIEGQDPADDSLEEALVRDALNKRQEKNSKVFSANMANFLMTINPHDPESADAFDAFIDGLVEIEKLMQSNQYRYPVDVSQDFWEARTMSTHDYMERKRLKLSSSDKDAEAFYLRLHDIVSKAFPEALYERSHEDTVAVDIASLKILHNLLVHRSDITTDLLGWKAKVRFSAEETSTIANSAHLNGVIVQNNVEIQDGSLVIHSKFPHSTLDDDQTVIGKKSIVVNVIGGVQTKPNSQLIRRAVKLEGKENSQWTTIYLSADDAMSMPLSQSRIWNKLLSSKVGSELQTWLMSYRTANEDLNDLADRVTVGELPIWPLSDTNTEPDKASEGKDWWTLVKWLQANDSVPDEFVRRFRARELISYNHIVLNHDEATQQNFQRELESEIEKLNPTAGSRISVPLAPGSSFKATYISSKESGARFAVSTQTLKTKDQIVTAPDFVIGLDLTSNLEVLSEDSLHSVLKTLQGAISETHIKNVNPIIFLPKELSLDIDSDLEAIYGITVERVGDSQDIRRVYQESAGAYSTNSALLQLDVGSNVLRIHQDMKSLTQGILNANLDTLGEYFDSSIGVKGDLRSKLVHSVGLLSAIDKRLTYMAIQAAGYNNAVSRVITNASGGDYLVNVHLSGIEDAGVGQILRQVQYQKAMAFEQYQGEESLVVDTHYTFESQTQLDQVMQKLDERWNELALDMVQNAEEAGVVADVMIELQKNSTIIGQEKDISLVLQSIKSSHGHLSRYDMSQFGLVEFSSTHQESFSNKDGGHLIVVTDYDDPSQTGFFLLKALETVIKKDTQIVYYGLKAFNWNALLREAGVRLAETGSSA